MDKKINLQWFDTFRQSLKRQNFRGLLILSGAEYWQFTLIKQIFTVYNSAVHIDHKPCFTRWQKKHTTSQQVNTQLQNLKDEVGHSLTFEISHFHHQLGTESDVVIFDDDTFHPDAFAALSGTITAGGMMVWLCHDTSLVEGLRTESTLINVNDSVKSENLFVKRLLTLSEHYDGIYHLTDKNFTLPDISESLTGNITEHLNGETAGDVQPALVTERKEVEKNKQQEHKHCLTFEQADAVNAIKKVITGHRKRPLVLTADRGRGKSSALAIAVAERISSNEHIEPQRIIITANHFNAVQTFFLRLAQFCPEGTFAKQHFYFNDHRVEFLPIDVLMTEQLNASFVVVDEAAAIPIYLLMILTTHYSRLIFSSTQHGYEGAGRGFAVKFKEALTKQCPDFYTLHIEEPIRWGKNDPLEQYIFDAFLLANPADEKMNSVIYEHSLLNSVDNVLRISRKQLFADESLLQNVFAVLVTAHYQTKPSDLKLLLNNEKVRVFVAFKEKTVIGVVLSIEEGNVEQGIVEGVKASEKRLKSQFLPQSLLIHQHVETAFDYRYLRIMRIAVLPNYQRSGVGKKLLDGVKDYSQNRGFDFIGTSFGAQPYLLDFWFENDFLFTRLGFTKDKASGESSTTYLMGLNEQSHQLIETLQIQFYRSFQSLLGNQYQQVNPDVVYHIIAQWPEALLPVMNDYDLVAVSHFHQKISLYDACAFSLKLCLIRALRLNTHANLLKNLKQSDLTFLIMKVLQEHSREKLVQDCSLTGKKAVHQKLVALFNQLITACSAD